MAILPILRFPDPRLRRPCTPVTQLDERLRQLAADMLDTMYAAPGRGLAGPQVGVMQRIFVMDANRDPEAERKPMVLLNPEIIWESEEQNVYEEGCLSIPEQYAEVTRPSQVKVSWLGLDGKQHQEEFDGLWATCAQHEIDHLDGVLFIDHISAMRRQMITRKMVKLKRERAREQA